MKDLLTSKRLRHLEEMVRIITPEELQTKIANREFVHLIDVSEPADFKKLHIRDAVNIPLEVLLPEVEKRFRKFQQLVVCSHEKDSAVGLVAARKLQQAGYSNVELLNTSAEAWRQAGLPLEGEEKDLPSEEKAS